MRRGSAGTEPRARLSTTVKATNKAWVEERGLEMSELLDEAIEHRRELDGSEAGAEPRWQFELRHTIAQRAGAGLLTPPEKFVELKEFYQRKYPTSIDTTLP